MTPFIRAIALAPFAALTLGGCISFGGKAPDSLLALRADAVPAQDVRSASAQTALTVVIPSVPQQLRTPRVPVTTGGTQIAYLKDAQWVEAPARMFQRLLSDTLAARGDRLVLNETELITGPGELLAGDLVEFGIDADRGEGVVTFVAMRMTNDGTRIAQRRFSAREPVGTLNPANAGAALNRAANRVAAEIAGWMPAAG